MTITFEPIGVIHSPHKGVEGTPIQPSRAEGAIGTIELLPEYADWLVDLDGFSHIILLYHFHKSPGPRPRVIPFLDTEERGLFATRSPCRPNPIGLSIVELLKVERNLLTVKGIDTLDGTPVLDIKPYVSEFDHRPDVRCGWFELNRSQTNVADSRFK